MKCLTLLLVLFCCSSFLFSQNPHNSGKLKSGTTGYLDTGFGNAGIVITDFNPKFGYLRALAIQEDGKIIAGGSSSPNSGHESFSMVRYNADGTPDQTFGDGGKVITAVYLWSDKISSIVVQNDGKILAGGSSYQGSNPVTMTGYFAVVRYNQNGTPDIDFGNNGIITLCISTYMDEILSMAVQSDGKIVLAGMAGSGFNARLAMARLNSNGTLDTSFGIDGKLTLPDYPNYSDRWSYAKKVLIQPDNNILVGGGMGEGTLIEHGFLARYTPSGELDPGFGIDGLDTTAMIINDIELTENEKIIATGSIGDGLNSDLAVSCFNLDGSPSVSFGTEGAAVLNLDNTGEEGISIYQLPNGDMIISGTTSNSDSSFVFCARYTSDGTINTNYFDQGVQIFNKDDFWGKSFVRKIMVQSDGKLLAAGNEKINGNYTFRLARYITNLEIGIIDFNQSSNLIYPNPVGQQATLSYSLTEDCIISVDLLDINGKQIMAIGNDGFETHGIHTRDIILPEDLASGIYLIRISSIKGQYTIRIVHQGV